VVNSKVFSQSVQLSSFGHYFRQSYPCTHFIPTFSSTQSKGSFISSPAVGSSFKQQSFKTSLKRRISQEVFQSVLKMSNNKSSNMGRESSSSSPALATPQSEVQAFTLSQPLLQPGTPGAPFFTGENVTEFLDTYEGMCEDSGLPVSRRAARLVKYCGLDRDDNSVADQIKQLPEWTLGDWDELKRVLKHEYRNSDQWQRIRNIDFLIQLSGQDDSRKNNRDLRVYLATFKTGATYLIGQGKLTPWMAGTLLLKGLPRWLASKIVGRLNIDDQDASTIDFDKIWKEASKIRQTEERTDAVVGESRVYPHEERVTPLPVPKSATFTQSQVNQPSRVGNNTHQSQRTTTFIPPPVAVSTSISRSLGGQTGQDVDDITQGMSKLSIQQIARQSAEEAIRVYTTSTSRPVAYQPRPEFGSRDPASNNYRPSEGVTCYFCGDRGHTQPRCVVVDRLLGEGVIHYDSDRRMCFGPQDQGGERIRFEKGVPTVEIIKGRAPESILPVIDAAIGKPSVKNVRLARLRTEEDDTESENSEYDSEEDEPARVRAATRDDKGKAPVRSRQGPVPDGTRRILKSREAKEAALPIAKSMRSGQYDKATNETPNSQGSQSTVQARQPSVEDVEDDDLQMTDAPRPKPRAKKAVSFEEDQPLTYQKALRTVRDEAHERVRNEVEKTIVNIQAGDALALLGIGGGKKYVVKDDQIKPYEPSKASKKRVDAVRITEPEDDGEEATLQAQCPEIWVSIHDKDFRALVDTGAQVNIMPYHVAVLLGLVVHRQTKSDLSGIGFGGHSTEFVGVVKNAIVDVEGLQCKTSFYVVDSTGGRHESLLLLGMPWQRDTGSKLLFVGGGMVVRIPHPEGGHIDAPAMELTRKEERSMRRARKFARLNLLSVTEYVSGEE
jgi:hypothetical protein